jgi:hypothetical protein
MRSVDAEAIRGTMWAGAGVGHGPARASARSHASGEPPVTPTISPET